MLIQNTLHILLIGQVIVISGKEVERSEASSHTRVILRSTTSIGAKIKLHDGLIFNFPRNLFLLHLLSLRVTRDLSNLDLP